MIVIFFCVMHFERAMWCSTRASVVWLTGHLRQGLGAEDLRSGGSPRLSRHLVRDCLGPKLNLHVSAHKTQSSFPSSIDPSFPSSIDRFGRIDDGLNPDADYETRTELK